jgi:hypothetical protein
LCAFISTFFINYIHDIHSNNLSEHIPFLFNMLQNKSTCTILLNWKKYPLFKIFYGLTLLDLNFVPVDERVCLNGCRGACAGRQAKTTGLPPKSVC